MKQLYVSQHRGVLTCCVLTDKTITSASCARRLAYIYPPSLYTSTDMAIMLRNISMSDCDKGEVEGERVG